MLPRAFGLPARIVQIILLLLILLSCQEPFFLETLVDGNLEGDEITAEETFFDYYVMAPVVTSDLNIAGSEITGTFDLGKNGLSGGFFDIQWAVYTSKNNLNNPVLLTQGETSLADVPATVGFSVNWPASAAGYYVIVVINYTDYDTSNNANSSGPYSVTN